jgi:hypothetical protein
MKVWLEKPNSEYWDLALGIGYNGTEVGVHCICFYLLFWRVDIEWGAI